MPRFLLVFIALLGIPVCGFSQPQTKTPRPMSDTPEKPRIPKFVLTGTQATAPSGSPMLNICYGAGSGAAVGGSVFNGYQVTVVDEGGALLLPPSSGNSPANHVNGYVNGLGLAGIPDGTHMITSLALFKPSGALLTGVYIEDVKGGASSVIPPAPLGVPYAYLVTEVTTHSRDNIFFPRHGIDYRIEFNPKLEERPPGNPNVRVGEPYAYPDVFWITEASLGGRGNENPTRFDETDLHRIAMARADWEVVEGKLSVDLTEALRAIDQGGAYLIPTTSHLVIYAWRQPTPGQVIGGLDIFVSPPVVR